MGANTQKQILWESGALELLEHAIPLDAADGRRDAEPLVGEVNLLGRLRAPELVDLKSVTKKIDADKGEVCGVCQRALTEG